MKADTNKPVADVTASITGDSTGKSLQLMSGSKALVTIPLTKKRADGIEAEVTGLSALLAQAPRAIRRMIAAQSKASTPAKQATKPAGNGALKSAQPAAKAKPRKTASGRSRAKSAPMPAAEAGQSGAQA